VPGGVPQNEVSQPSWRRNIITQSAVMEDILTKAGLVAEGDASVLIYGESGVGKELFAHAIHEASKRRHNPFVAINCAAIPEQLLESELFGHVKGAFTGAVRDHKGLFQLAESGTLFLDEIGDMPVLLQVKLLRVLQERKVRPVGSTQAIPIDVRIISATHRDLKAEIAAGGFREDLYYRLDVVALTIPVLSQRREDIPLLTNYFLSMFAEKYQKNINGFSPEAMEMPLRQPHRGEAGRVRITTALEQKFVSTAAGVAVAVTGKEHQADLHLRPPLARVAGSIPRCCGC